MYTYRYPRPALTVDAIIYVKDSERFSLLLIKRGREPFLGQWALPGGFVEMDELLEESCLRELKEETGLQLSDIRQYKVFDAVDRDPRGRTISVIFYAELESQKEVRGGDDAALARWFPFFDLPQMAFDHYQIVQNFFHDHFPGI
jgi:8-oxo-dGTP diphosphatase